MIKIFDSTCYVRTDIKNDSLLFSKPDVEPLEPYLQLKVKPQWDWNNNDFFLVFDGEFKYYVVLASKENNQVYHSYKKFRTEEITKEYKKVIDKFLKR